VRNPYNAVERVLRSGLVLPTPRGTPPTGLLCQRNNPYRAYNMLLTRNNDQQASHRPRTTWGATRLSRDT
jgi:hypothetical protein